MTDPAPPDRWLAGAVLAGLAVTAAVGALLLATLVPLGVPGEWEWLPRTPAAQPGAFTLLAALLLALAVLYVSRALRRAGGVPRRRGLGLALLCSLCAGALQCGPVFDNARLAANLSSVTVSISAMGYYSYAATRSLAEGFGAYVTREDGGSFPGRMQTHPPGPYLTALVAHRLARACPWLTAPAMSFLQWRFGMSVKDLHALASALAVPGLRVADMPGAWCYGLAITLAGALLPLATFLLAAALWDRRAGLIAALLATTLPSLVAFVPSIDGLAAVLAVLTMALLAAAVRGGRWWLAGLAGLVWFLAVLWTPGLLVLGLPLLGLVPGTPRERRPLWLLVLACGVVVLALLVLYLTTGYGFVHDFHVMSTAHRGQTGYRTYASWLPANLWDFVLFLGPALSLLVAASLRDWRRWPATARGAVGGSLLTLGLLLLSGFTRGEIGRIWLFLMPLVSLGVSGWLSGLPAAFASRWLGVLTVTQGLLALVLAGALDLVHP